MPNPIQYKDLFDVDGLKLAVKELTAETDAYGTAATQDFKRINNVVSSLKKELEGLGVLMSKPIKLMEESGQAQAKDYAAQISELTKQVRTQQAAIESMNKVMTEQKQVIMDAKVAAAEFSKELAKEKVVTQEVRTEIALKTLQLKELALNTKSATAAQVAANGSYTEAQRTLSALGKEIKGTENGLKTLTPELSAKITQYNKLNDELKEFDAKMGNFQRNVGNYKSGFAGLNNSIAQIGRELPALGINFQTFALAISNNLPIFADNVKESAAAIKAMREEGKQVPGIFTQILKGVFSLQTLLSVGITLFVLYSKEISTFVQALFKSTAAIDAAKLSLEALNKGFDSTDFASAIKDVNELTINFKLAKEGVVDKDTVLKQYNDTLGKTLGETDDLNIAEQLTAANAPKYIEATLLKAAANITLQDSAKKAAEAARIAAQPVTSFENVGDRGNLLNIRSQAEADNARKQILANERKRQAEQVKAAKDEADALSKIGEDLLKKAANVATGYKKTNTELLDNQLTTYEQIRNRITELSKLPGSAIDGSAINNRIDALKARLKELSGTAKDAKEGFALLEEQLQKVVLQLQKAIILDYAKHQGVESENTKKLAESYALLTDKLTKLKEAQKASQDSASNRLYFKQTGNISQSPQGDSFLGSAGGIADALRKSDLIKELETTERGLQSIDAAYTKSNQAIFKTYKDKKITITQYNDQIQQAQDKQADEVFTKEKKAAEIRLQLATMGYGKGSKEYVAALKALGDIQERYNKDSLNRDERLYAAKLKLQQETIAVLQKSAQTIARLTGNSGLGSLFGDLSTDLINGIGDSERFQKIAELGMDSVNTYTEFAIEASNRRIEQLNKERDHDIGLAGNNAEAKAKIEEEYNKKISAEKSKQARLARAAAAIDIIINTAVAVSKVIGQTGIFGIGLAPIVAALGAVELGIVLSQPLPQYAKGRNGGNAELAEVNERGPELIGQRGKWRLANRGMRGVTYLNQGDQVKTATDTKQMLANGMITADGQYVTNVSQSKSIYDNYIMASNKQSGIDYDRMAGAVANGVSVLPVTEHNYNERGYQQNLRTKNTRMLDINRRNRF